MVPYNTIKDLFLMSMAAKRMNKLHTMGLDDTANYTHKNLNYQNTA